MRTDQERILIMHRRAALLIHQREKKTLILIGGACFCLSVLLAAVTAHLTALPYGMAGSDFTGASLLAESTGGYVLAAVIAFMAGVVITAALIRRRNHNKDSPGSEEDDTE